MRRTSINIGKWCEEISYHAFGSMKAPFYQNQNSMYLLEGNDSFLNSIRLTLFESETFENLGVEDQLYGIDKLIVRTLLKQIKKQSINKGENF